MGIYARHNVVAEMKRTSRAKDWPFATGLGGLMLMEQNPSGWLHIYDINVLKHSLRTSEVPADLLTSRPLLKLAPFDDALKVKRILMAEQAFWSELDEIRVRIFQRHLRPYVSAVRRASAGRRDMSIIDSHAIRVGCAEQHLPQQPLRDHGLERMLEQARNNVAVTVGKDVIEWLPTAESHFYGL